VEFREDATGKNAEIHITGAPFMIKVKENAREIEEIKEFFRNVKEED
jgi:ABC superfamily ATP binding cassette transporter